MFSPLSPHSQIMWVLSVNLPLDMAFLRLPCCRIIENIWDHFKLLHSNLNLIWSWLSWGKTLSLRSSSLENYIWIIRKPSLLFARAMESCSFCLLLPVPDFSPMLSVLLSSQRWAVDSAYRQNNSWPYSVASLSHSASRHHCSRFSSDLVLQ